MLRVGWLIRNPYRCNLPEVAVVMRLELARFGTHIARKPTLENIFTCCLPNPLQSLSADLFLARDVATTI